MSQYYLGKSGKVFGPFTPEQIGELRLSGEIENYTYLWSEAESKWENIDPPPPAPGGEGTKINAVSVGISPEAICHNSFDIVSGWLENISDSGCELVANLSSESPKLGRDAPCTLNVMDGSKSKAINVKARMVKSEMIDGKWVYQIRWAGRPTF